MIRNRKWNCYNNRHKCTINNGVTKYVPHLEKKRSEGGRPKKPEKSYPGILVRKDIGKELLKG
eukprot:776229-Prorocentrum_minimum.AAC.1